MSKRSELLKRCIILQMLLLSACLWTSESVSASTLVPQTAVVGGTISQFAVPLPVFGPAGPIPRVNALSHPFLSVTMKEINQQVLPAPYGPTRVWAYEIRDTFTGKLLAPANWPGVTVVTRRSVPTVVTYVNQLPSFDQLNPQGPGLVQGLITVDQSIHWSDPLGLGCVMRDPPVDCSATPFDPCCQPYTGPVPAVAHLHGGEVPSASDGGPDAWFTPTGQTGPAYSTIWNTGPGTAVYEYPNSQEPGTLFFHDHALGATRTNLYSGLVAFYFIRDPNKEPQNLPTGPYEIEIVLQDRQFDTTGQLYWPDGSGADNATSNLNGPPPNPSIHPFWIPEFIGDVAIANGGPWPFFDVQPRRYLFRLVDGSNARFYRLTFGKPALGEPQPPVYQIGADDNYLDKPVRLNPADNETVFIAPGERAYVIVDFSGLAGDNVTVTNDAAVPYPDGLIPGSPGQEGMTNIMRFRVSSVPVNDKSCNPATGGCNRPSPMVRLTDGKGNVAHGVKINKKRQLILKEVEGPGGPIEVLVNNTKWDGTRSPGICPNGVCPPEFPDGVTELPRVGSIEEWEIINLTDDAHPMHTHLTQFQILNREDYNTDPTTGYPAAWEYAFPGSDSLGCAPHVFCPGYGPPLPYKKFNADHAIGGNPAISAFLSGNPKPPNPEESGWKDTAKVYPSQVLRILVRWAPTSTRVPWSRPGLNFYPFNPTEGPGYVWHCHILDHEDNEMMRPYKVKN